MNDNANGGPGVDVTRVPFLTLYLAVILPSCLAMFDQTMVATALPAIAGDLSGTEQLTSIVVFYLATTALVAPIYGRLGDAFGRRLMMAIALTVVIFGSVVCALANSMSLLSAGRILQGIGGGGLLAMSQALIGQSLSPRERGRYQGYLVATNTMAATLGPVLGGFLTEFVSWRAVFVINIPLGILALVLLAQLPSKQSRSTNFSFDWVGAVLFATLIGGALFLVEELRAPAQASHAWLLGMGCVAAITALLFWEQRARDPLFPLKLLAGATVWRCNALAMAQGAFVVSMIIVIPIYFSLAFEMSPAQIGLHMLPLTGGIGIGSVLSGQIISKTGRSAIIPSIGLLVLCAGLITLALAIHLMSPLFLAWYLGLVTIFGGTVMTVVQITVQAEVGSFRLGSGAAAVQLARAFGASLGTAIAGALLFASVSGSGEGLAMVQLLLASTRTDAATAAQANIVRADLLAAFPMVFLLLAASSALASVLAWTMPRRRID